MDSVASLFLATLLFLARTGTDIVAFFIVVRMIKQLLWSPRWVAAFDNAGASLVNGILRIFDWRLLRLSSMRWREGAKLSLSLLVLSVIRIALD